MASRREPDAMVGAQVRLAERERGQPGGLEAALDQRRGRGCREPGRMASDVIAMPVRDKGEVAAAWWIQGETDLVEADIVAKREQCRLLRSEAGARIPRGAWRMQRGIARGEKIVHRWPGTYARAIT